VRPRRRDGVSIVVAFQGCRLPVGAVMRLDRALLALLRIRAKHLVRKLFLLIRHSVIKRLESGNESLHMLGVRLSNLLVRLHVLQRVHRLKLLCAFDHDLIHVAGILAHHFGKLIPLRPFRRGNAKLSVQLLDTMLDALLGILAGNRVTSHRRGYGGWRSSLRRRGWDLRGLRQGRSRQGEQRDQSCGSQTV
jgi:hypothetical protein